MKTKMHWLMALALLVMLAGMNTSPAQAADVTTVFEQLPNQYSAAVSDSTYCGTVSNCLAADNFVVPAGKTLTINTIQLWGFYQGDASAYMDNFTIVFYADWNGQLGDTFPAILPATTTREATGAFLGGSVREYLFTLTLREPQTFNAGTYWISIYNGGGDPAANRIFTWELTSNADSGGLSRSTIAEFDSVNGWQANTGYSYLALRLIGSLVTPPVTHTISGYVFNDLDGNGTWDSGETGLDGAYVSIDMGCSGISWDQGVNLDGSYVISGLPSGTCVALSADRGTGSFAVGWKETTPAVKFDPLGQDETGVNIGLQEYSLDYTPRSTPWSQGLPDGQLNQPYSQAVTVSGGVTPYTFSPASEGNLPANGLDVTTDGATGVITISGTPTVAGEYLLDLNVQDAKGIRTEVQGQFFVKTDAAFNLTSSANPSNLGDSVTFSLSASGNIGPYSPNGPVTFKADGVVIAGCDQLILGYDEFGAYTNPVQCITSALAAGEHVIAAEFAPTWGPYNAATITLTQVVQPAVAAPVVTKTFVQPEPSLAGYPMIRPYVYFTGQAGNGNYSCTVDYGDGNSLTGRVEGRGLDPSNVPQYICDSYIDAYHEFYTYANPGIYTLKFTIHDIYGNETIHQATHTVVADPDLGYITWSPSPAVVGQPVTFTTTQTADYYGWLLVSGPDIPTPAAFGTGPSATFQPASAGTYKVELILGYLNAGTMTMVADGAEIVVVEPVQADLSLTKTDSKDPVKPGASLVYTLTVKNLGPNAAETVVLSDKLDPNTTYVSTSAPKGWKCSYAKNSATVTCTTSGLASGSSAIIKITVTVNKTARVGKELVNNATVSSLVYDPVIINNSVVQKTLVAK